MKSLQNYSLCLVMPAHYPGIVFTLNEHRSQVNGLVSAVYMFTPNLLRLLTDKQRMSDLRKHCLEH